MVLAQQIGHGSVGTSAAGAAVSASAATGAAASVAAAAGTCSATSSAVAAAPSGSPPGIGTSAGSSTATAAGLAVAKTSGTAAGSSQANAVAQGEVAATGTSNGTSLAAAVGRSTVPGEGLRASCLRFDLASKRVSTDEILAVGGAPGALYADLRTDTLYVASGATVRPAHSGSAAAAAWRSKVFKIPSGARQGFAWVRVKGTFTDGVALRFYADGVLRHSKAGVTTLQPMRMPALEARAWEVEIVGADRVTELVLADSEEGLLA